MIQRDRALLRRAQIGIFGKETQTGVSRVVDPATLQGDADQKRGHAFGHRVAIVPRRRVEHRVLGRLKAILILPGRVLLVHEHTVARDDDGVDVVQPGRWPRADAYPAAAAGSTHVVQDFRHANRHEDPAGLSDTLSEVIAAPIAEPRPASRNAPVLTMTARRSTLLITCKPSRCERKVVSSAQKNRGRLCCQTGSIVPRPLFLVKPIFAPGHSCQFGHSTSPHRSADTLGTRGHVSKVPAAEVDAFAFSTYVDRSRRVQQVDRKPLA